MFRQSAIAECDETLAGLILVRKDEFDEDEADKAQEDCDGDGDGDIVMTTIRMRMMID